MSKSKATFHINPSTFATFQRLKRNLRTGQLNLRSNPHKNLDYQLKFTLHREQRRLELSYIRRHPSIQFGIDEKFFSAKSFKFGSCKCPGCGKDITTSDTNALNYVDPAPYLAAMGRWEKEWAELSQRQHAPDFLQADFLQADALEAEKPREKARRLLLQRFPHPPVCPNCTALRNNLGTEDTSEPFKASVPPAALVPLALSSVPNGSLLVVFVNIVDVEGSVLEELGRLLPLSVPSIVIGNQFDRLPVGVTRTSQATWLRQRFRDLGWRHVVGVGLISADLDKPKRIQVIGSLISKTVRELNITNIVTIGAEGVGKTSFINAIIRTQEDHPSFDREAAPFCVRHYLTVSEIPGTTRSFIPVSFCCPPAMEQFETESSCEQVPMFGTITDLPGWQAQHFHSLSARTAAILRTNHNPMVVRFRIVLPGSTLFVTGLYRLDLVDGPPEGIRVAVVVPVQLAPAVSVVRTTMAASFYGAYVGNQRRLIVPLAAHEAPLDVSVNLVLKGNVARYSSADIALRSVGWVSVCSGEPSAWKVHYNEAFGCVRLRDAQITFEFPRRHGLGPCLESEQACNAIEVPILDRFVHDSPMHTLVELPRHVDKSVTIDSSEQALEKSDYFDKLDALLPEKPQLSGGIE